MAVHVTTLLATALGADDCATLIENFRLWKHNWPESEFASKHFGKDGAYVNIKVGTESYQLMHVHLTPLIDVDARERWFQAFRRLGRKVSDRALVYAQD